jgi:hypothetical protein
MCVHNSYAEMSLGTKIHHYQSWYGEKCPYTKPAIKIKPFHEEREFIPPISKGLATSQYREIILGPKRERPNSAVRTSSSKRLVMPIRPTSGLRCRAIREPEPQRHQDSRINLSEEKILKIRFPFLDEFHFLKSFLTVPLWVKENDHLKRCRNQSLSILVLLS